MEWTPHFLGRARASKRQHPAVDYATQAHLSRGVTRNPGGVALFPSGVLRPIYYMLSLNHVHHVPCHVTPGRGLHCKFGRDVSSAQTKISRLCAQQMAPIKSVPPAVAGTSRTHRPVPCTLEVGHVGSCPTGKGGGRRDTPLPSCACPDTQHAKGLRVPTTSGWGARLCARPCPHIRNLAASCLKTHCFPLFLTDAAHRKASSLGAAAAAPAGVARPSPWLVVSRLWVSAGLLS